MEFDMSSCHLKIVDSLIHVIDEAGAGLLHKETVLPK